jgi:hypothetical protein
MRVCADFLQVHGIGGQNDFICDLGLAPADDWEPALAAEVNANARLIAAAPCMFEALTKCLPFIDDALDAHSVMSDSVVTAECRNAVNLANAALRKARGETSLAQAEAPNASE